MTYEQKEWIDNASYRDLSERWRNSSCGDSLFGDDFQNDEVGRYFKKVMLERKARGNKQPHDVNWD